MQALQELMAVYADIISEAEETGERTVLIRLLTQRFGPLPEEAMARIRRAHRATLERWTDRLLTARSLDDVLD